MKKQLCPICSAEVTPNERYPRYLCPVCVEKVTSADGRKVDFENTTFMGMGFSGFYADTKEPYPSHDCYVGTIKCYAAEARFGGIVIEIADV